jgi:hypothetical protein
MIHISTLDRSIEIATKGHECITYKFGAPFIDQVIRVMY